MNFDRTKSEKTATMRHLAENRKLNLFTSLLKSWTDINFQPINNIFKKALNISMVIEIDNV